MSMEGNGFVTEEESKDRTDKDTWLDAEGHVSGYFALQNEGTSQDLLSV